MSIRLTSSHRATVLVILGAIAPEVLIVATCPRPVHGEQTIRAFLEVVMVKSGSGPLGFTRSASPCRRQRRDTDSACTVPWNASAAVEFVAQPGRTVNMEVAVDLPHRKIRLTCDGATVEPAAGAAPESDHACRSSRHQRGHRLCSDPDRRPLNKTQVK